MATPTPTSTPNPDPNYYYEGMVVTLDDVGRTVVLRIGQNFLLELGEDYTWDIEIEPATIVSKNMKITPQANDQGVFIARKRGKAVLMAVGEPSCRQSQPPCGRPNVLFQVTVVVE